jgi:ComF family protein
VPPPRFLDLCARALLPPLCVHCGDPLRDARPGVCRWCRATLRSLPPGCLRCGLPRPGSPTECDRCREWPPGLIAVAATRYVGAAESIAHALKYNGWTHLADLCASRMMDALGSRVGDIEALAPVPLHRARQRERGFNQSELLARALAGLLGVPLVEPLLRARATPSQVGLGRAARRRNVADAFVPASPVRARRLGLVDDVATSGATLASAAAALLEAGAERITAVTFALALTGPLR